jgi:6-pyruvoyltetrahydropterin/6-carboxytetrahydropterin synthase
VTIHVTRRYRFCASHRLHSRELSEARNRELYGKCNNVYGHGHDYVLEVTVAGPLDKSTGRVCDPATLDALVTRYVLSEVDHKNLNEDLPEFAASVPTSENLTKMIEARLKQVWMSAFPDPWPRLTRIRLAETKRNSFELTT